MGTETKMTHVELAVHLACRAECVAISYQLDQLADAKRQFSNAKTLRGAIAMFAAGLRERYSDPFPEKPARKKVARR